MKLLTGFLLFRYLCRYKTKPDSLIAQGLPGFNITNVVLLYV